MNQQNLPLVSVVIPTYNRCEYVCKAIDSVLAQTYPNVEVIVVDDESSDQTFEVVPKKYKGQIHFIRKKNGGVSAARNRALEDAKGEFVAFLDDDDLWLGNKLEKEMPLLLNHPEYAFVYSGAFYIDEHDKVIGERTQWDDEEPTFQRLFKGNIILSPSLVTVKKNCLNEYGMFDTNLRQSSDYDLWLRIAKHRPFGYVNENLIHYRIHSQNMSKNWDERLANHMRIFSKKEITDGFGFWAVRRRKANSYYYIAQEYERDRKYTQAARKYTRAVLFFPFIGMDYWPQESKKFRFSLIYRILKPYMCIFMCGILGLIKMIKR